MENTSVCQKGGLEWNDCRGQHEGMEQFCVMTAVVATGLHVFVKINGNRCVN